MTPAILRPHPFTVAHLRKKYEQDPAIKRQQQRYAKRKEHVRQEQNDVYTLYSLLGVATTLYALACLYVRVAYGV